MNLNCLLNVCKTPILEKILFLILLQIRPAVSLNHIVNIMLQFHSVIGSTLVLCKIYDFLDCVGDILYLFLSITQYVFPGLGLHFL